MELDRLVLEARAILEATPGTAGTLPLVVRWLLDRLRKDSTAREKLLDGVERVMLAMGEDLTTQTPEELVHRTLEALDKNSRRFLSDTLDFVQYEEAFEDFLVQSINDEVPTANGLGPWECHTAIGSGEVTVRLKLAGEEQEEDTEHPGDTEESAISRVFKTTLGASSATFRWLLDHTPSNWGGASGDKYVLAYEGRADFAYRDGQAILFALGNKALLALATKTLASLKESV